MNKAILLELKKIKPLVSDGMDIDEEADHIESEEEEYDEIFKGYEPSGSSHYSDSSDFE